jgi:hypothetical protein
MSLDECLLVIYTARHTFAFSTLTSCRAFAQFKKYPAKTTTTARGRLSEALVDVCLLPDSRQKPFVTQMSFCEMVYRILSKVMWTMSTMGNKT